MASYIVDIDAIVTVRVEAESESAAEDMAIRAPVAQGAPSEGARDAPGDADNSGRWPGRW